MAEPTGYYDPYTEEYIENAPQDALDFYQDFDYDNAVGYDDPYFNGYEYDDDYYGYNNDTIGYGKDDWSLSDLPDFSEVGEGVLDSLTGVAKKYGSKVFNAAKGLVTKTVDGKEVTDWNKIAGIAGGLYSAYSANQPKPPTGYQGKIPEYTAVRQQVENTYDPNRRPGSSGQRYFTDTKYTPADGVGAAKTADSEEAAGLAALNAANPAKQARPQSATENAIAQAEKAADVETKKDASSVIADMPVPEYAAGGIANLATGGKPRYLAGQTDGMADKIKANIDGNQEARLSHGEFVIPADVVGHLGNGNSEAGAERLYAMMDRIRKARTGTKKQGKQINPDKYLAA
jgi:hypothetical protein